MKFILLFIKIGKFLRLKCHRQIHRERADDMNLNFSLKKETSLKTVIMYVNFSLGKARSLVFVQCCHKESETLSRNKRPKLCSDKTKVNH